MQLDQRRRTSGARTCTTLLTLAATLIAASACASSTPPASTPTPTQPAATRQDPRVGLKAGLMDAGEAVSNLRVMAKAVSPPGFLGIFNSDMALC